MAPSLVSISKSMLKMWHAVLLDLTTLVPLNHSIADGGKINNNNNNNNNNYDCNHDNTGIFHILKHGLEWMNLIIAF